MIRIEERRCNHLDESKDWCNYYLVSTGARCSVTAESSAAVHSGDWRRKTRMWLSTWRLRAACNARTVLALVFLRSAQLIHLCSSRDIIPEQGGEYYVLWQMLERESTLPYRCWKWRCRGCALFLSWWVLGSYLRRMWVFCRVQTWQIAHPQSHIRLRHTTRCSNLTLKERRW